MHTVLANWLADQIATKHYADLVTGVVMSYTRKTESGKRFVYPGVTSGYGLPTCDTPEIFEVAPDSSRKSIFFFEDLTGEQVVKYEGNFIYFRATVRLIGWLNLAKLGLTGQGWGTKIMLDILSTIPDGVINIPEHHINAGSIIVGSTLPRGQGIWAGYSVFRDRKDFLHETRHDHFAVNLELTWRMSKACLASIPQNDPTDCAPFNPRPTWCDITRAKVWADIKACMAAEEITAAAADLGVGGGCGPSTVQVIVNGVADEPIEVADPCDDQTYNINITFS